MRLFFSARISLSNPTDRTAVFSDRVSLSILDMTGGFQIFACYIPAHIKTRALEMNFKAKLEIKN